MGFNVELVKRIASGSIKTVQIFGDSMEHKKTPYVIVKPIAGGNRKLLQIIVHVNLGMEDKLEAYILIELTTLLNKPISFDGKSVTAISTGAWFGPYVDEKDNTLVMSRDFFVPVII
jgi:hypothetical protein